LISGAKGYSRPTVGGSTVALFLDAVSKRFGETVAMNDVTVAVERGTFFSLLGPSGCGKTTTLRTVGGFESPDAGAVLLDGIDVTHQPPNRRNVNTVFQSYALFPHLSVFENVAYGLRRRGAGRSEVLSAVGEMLELVGLAGMQRRKPASLSGGQQQRVALARALVNRPAVLLLDEPLGALDLALRRSMQLELKRIQHEVGITFVYVTHDQDEAMAMSDTLAVMNHGRIEHVGTPSEVYEAPASAFVASFLGAANLLSGVVASRDADWATIALQTGETIWVASALLNGDRNVRVGVRPEKLRISRNGIDTNALNVLEGIVTQVTFTGVGFQYGVDTPAGERIVVYEQNLGSSPAQTGDDVRITWRPEHTFTVAGEAG
jgi:spermidine/putrescine transport system ATP-binding protein